MECDADVSRIVNTTSVRLAGLAEDSLYKCVVSIRDDAAKNFTPISTIEGIETGRYQGNTLAY